MNGDFPNRYEPKEKQTVTQISDSFNEGDGKMRHNTQYNNSSMGLRSLCKYDVKVNVCC